MATQEAWATAAHRPGARRLAESEGVEESRLQEQLACQALVVRLASAEASSSVQAAALLPAVRVARRLAAAGLRAPVDPSPSVARLAAPRAEARPAELRHSGAPPEAQGRFLEPAATAARPASVARAPTLALPAAKTRVRGAR